MFGIKYLGRILQLFLLNLYMQDDKLPDFEKIDYYKSKLKSGMGFTVVTAILMFVLGVVIARVIYLFPNNSSLIPTHI